MIGNRRFSKWARQAREKLVLIATLFFLLWNAGEAQAALCTSTTAGNWSTLTWSCGHVPTTTDDVVISTNVTVNVNTAVLLSLTVSAGVTLTTTTKTVSAGTLTINNTGIFNCGDTLTITGASTIDGTLNITNGNNDSLGGLVTVSSTGVWNNSGNQPVTFQGGIANAGTFTAGTGLQTFNTNAQTISGASAINFGGNVVVTGVTVTNTNTAGVTITGTLTGTGGWTNGDGTTAAVLNYVSSGNAAAPGITTFTANAVGNKVTYGRANTQTIRAITYHHLELGGTSAKTAAAGLTVNGDFTLSGSASFTASTFTHDFYGNWNVNTTAASPLSTTTTSLITFNAPATPAATSVGGTSTATLTFADVTINNPSGVTFNLNASFAGTTPTLTVAANATFTPAAGVIISGAAGTLTGNGIAQVTHVGTSGGDFAAQYTIATKTLTNLTIDYAGASAQFADALTTYGSMKISNASGVTLAGNATVNTTLILNTGVLKTTAGFTLTTAANCPGSVSRTSGWVAGFLSLKFPVAAPITCTYYVGDNTNYRPIAVTFASVSVTGSMVGSVTQSAGEHAQIVSSLINSAKDVNYYWTLTNGTIAFTNYSATFSFNATDYDAGADPTKFIAQRYSSGWTSPTVDGAACTNCVAVTGITAGFGDFVAGETTFAVSTNPGWFNAFETTTTPNTSITGKIYTKLVGSNFDLAVVAVNAYRTALKPNYTTNPITVELLDASDNSGGITNETGCRSTWVAMSPAQSFSLSPTWTSSRATVTIPAQTKAARDVRVRVTEGTRVGCSTDNFSIRPTSFTVSSTNATNTDTSGTPIIKTGANFNLTATAVAGYNGTPSLDNGKVTGTTTAGTIGGSFSAAPIGTGIASGSTFYYSEVGNFGLNANAVYDSSFTSVDTSGTDCTADFSNTADASGRFGCSFGSTAVVQNTGVTGFGRFTPDNFNVSYNTPVFSVSCSTFSYVGQTFTYTTAPVMTITARNGTNNGLTNATTVNYTGSYAKFSNAAGTSLNQTPFDTRSGRYAAFDALSGVTPALDTTGLPLTTADPTISTFTAGVGTFTFSSGTGLLFTRSATTPNAPFNADIALSLNVIDTDGVAFAGNPAKFGAATAGNGIAFTGGNKTMRFGRLQLSNSHGSEMLTLRVPVQAQYWNGNTFVTNTDDNCTPLTASTVTMDDYKGSLAACNTGLSVIGGANLSSGLGKLLLSAPGIGKSGSVRLRLNLGTASGNTCLTAGGSQSAATSAAESYLGVKSGANYDGDPTVRATFGVRRAGPVIYMREMY